MTNLRPERPGKSMVLGLAAHAAQVSIGLAVTTLLFNRLETSVWLLYVAALSGLHVAGVIVDAGLQPLALGVYQRSGQRGEDLIVAFRRRLTWPVTGVGLLAAFFAADGLVRLMLLLLAMVPLLYPERTRHMRYVHSVGFGRLQWLQTAVQLAYFLALFFLLPRVDIAIAPLVVFGVLACREAAAVFGPRLVFGRVGEPQTDVDHQTLLPPLAGQFSATLLGAVYFHLPLWSVLLVSTSENAAAFGYAFRLFQPLLSALTFVTTPLGIALSHQDTRSEAWRLAPVTAAAALAPFVIIAQMATEPVISHHMLDVLPPRIPFVLLVMSLVPVVFGASGSFVLISRGDLQIWRRITAEALGASIVSLVLFLPIFVLSGAAASFLLTETFVAWRVLKALASAAPKATVPMQPLLFALVPVLIGVSLVATFGPWSAAWSAVWITYSLFWSCWWTFGPSGREALRALERAGNDKRLS